MQPAILRYTTKAFPRYRYLPARNPHPNLHPEGHSYQKNEDAAEALNPEQWTKNSHYLYGVDLFNHGYWWEAHEAWETLWLTTEKTDVAGQFLQGLIQFSAALLKLYGGLHVGFEKLYGEARRRLEYCLEQLKPHHRTHFMGLNLLAWLEQFAGFRENAQHYPNAEIDALQFCNFPAILLDK